MWLKREGTAWRRVVWSPAPFIITALVAIGLAAAWQTGFNYTFDPAGSLQLKDPFLNNFNAVEYTKPDKMAYRWTMPESSIAFLGIGARDYRLTLLLQPSTNPSPTVTVTANSTALCQFTLPPGPKTYSCDIPARAITQLSGDLILTLSTPQYQAPRDRRVLGVVFMRAELQATSDGVVVPPLVLLGWLLAAILLIYCVVVRAGFKGIFGGVVAAGVGALFVMLIGSSLRAWLTIVAPQLAVVCLVALAVVVVSAIPLRMLAAKQWAEAWLLTFVGLAIIMRLAALVHPFTWVVDLGFHVNRFVDLWQAHNYYQTIISTEWGNRPTYYPATMYGEIGLFQWLVPDTRFLLTLWMVIFDTNRALLIFYLVKRTLDDELVGVLAAFFMVVLPVDFISLTFGQVANLYGEWLILVGLCLLVVKFHQLRQWPYFGLLTLVLLACFIQHPGVIIIGGVAFLCLSAALVWYHKSGAKPAFGAYFLALALSIAIYNRVTLVEMIPQMFDTLSQTVGGISTKRVRYVGGSVSDTRLGLRQKPVTTTSEWLWGGLGGFWGEAIAYYRLLPLIALPWAAGQMWRHGAPGTLQSRRNLVLAATVWFGVALLFAVIGWVLNLYVRYALFVLPFAAIGMGVALAFLWRRFPRYGVGMTLMVCAYYLVTFGLLWYDRVISNSLDHRL